MTLQELQQTVQEILTPGRGILAADESTGTIAKRLDSIGVESSEETRRTYRNLLFTTPGMEDFVSGVILFEETLRQKALDGTPFPELLAAKGVVPGIKVDKGAKVLAGSPEEKVTEGLDGLRERLAEYKALGARFAKWRAVITIGPGLPTPCCIETNAHALARYAALSQEAGIVPIVEPEVLMDADNTIERCFEVTGDTLRCTFDQLHRQNVALEGILLKPNMVISGKQCAAQATREQVAAETLRCFAGVVPAAVPGCVFLSGGQSDEDATAHLDAMNKLGPHPWTLSYSYGRALQAAALQAWGGEADRLETAKRAFHHRARMNGAAQRGEWSPALEEELVTA